MLTRPRAIPPNAHIAVLAASGASELVRIEEAAHRIEQRGMRVSIASNVATRHRGYLAGDDATRVEELNRHLRSSEFDAFFFARGGYGAMRILDRVDYAAVRANPRPIVGFSDVTALHQAVALHSGVASFHGPMLNLDFHDALSVGHEAWLWSLLGGDSPSVFQFDPSNVLFAGDVEGVLFGGCLSLTAALIGTPYDFWVDDGIWFWEDIEEAPYRIDRMLTHLRLSGRMQRIRGVVVGRLRGCGSEEEIDALLSDFFASMGIPVVRNFPFGHHGDNLLMPIGAAVRLNTSDNTFTISEAVVDRR